MANSNEREPHAFLPLPDTGNAGKLFWMLPNLTSFTNIYARINLFTRGRLDGVRLMHDEQRQFDRILTEGKASVERFAERGLRWPIRHADFSVIEQASLVFGESRAHAGIQFADVLAGFVMRHVHDVIGRGRESSSEVSDSFRLLLELSDPPKGIGINFVLPMVDVLRLGVLPARF